MAAAAHQPKATIAAPYDDVGERILTTRKVPCICACAEQGASARTIDYSVARGIVVERVECTRCRRTWTRVNA